MAVATGTILIFAVIGGISGIIGLVFYILQAIGIYKMANSLGIAYPWISFIPVANSYTFGKVASRYIKRDGSASAKFEIWLLVLQILMTITAILLVITAIIAIVSIVGFADAAILDDSAMTLSMFSSFIPVIILYVVTFGLALAYNIIYYVALWRIFSIFSADNATIFTVLSVLFNILPPIFLFVIRNSNPTVTYDQRMGFEEL